MERKLAIIAEGQDRSGSKMLKGLNGDLGGLDKSAKGLASGGLKELTSSLGGSLGGLGSGERGLSKSRRDPEGGLKPWSEN
jgi:hypothetical protein